MQTVRPAGPMRTRLSGESDKGVVMRVRTSIGAVALVLAVSGCSSIPFFGDGTTDVDDMDYCERIDHFADQVRSLGQVKTEDAFAGYVEVLESIAAVAPDETYGDADSTVQEDWQVWARLTQGFVDAHAEIGFALADRYDPEKVAELSDEEKTTLNNATYVYNVAGDIHTRLAGHVQESCSIDLSTQGTTEVPEPATENGDD